MGISDIQSAGKNTEWIPLGSAWYIVMIAILIETPTGFNWWAAVRNQNRINARGSCYNNNAKSLILHWLRNLLITLQSEQRQHISNNKLWQTNSTASNNGCRSSFNSRKHFDFVGRGYFYKSNKSIVLIHWLMQTDAWSVSLYNATQCQEFNIWTLLNSHWCDCTSRCNSWFDQPSQFCDGVISLLLLEISALTESVEFHSF